METNKVFYIASILLIGACFFSFSLSTQEDELVEFSFNKPNFKTDIWFYDLGHNPFIDVRYSRKDTVGDLFYQSELDLPYHVRLDPGQVYTRIFQDATDWRFIKATVFVKYQVGSPTRRRGSYEKIFDLEEIRDKSSTTDTEK